MNSNNDTSHEERKRISVANRCYYGIKKQLKSHLLTYRNNIKLYKTLYNKIFPGYQPCHSVKQQKNQQFKNHLCPRLQGTDVSGESVHVRYRPA
jgi:hypothetical protein